MRMSRIRHVGIFIAAQSASRMGGTPGPGPPPVGLAPAPLTNGGPPPGDAPTASPTDFLAPERADGARPPSSAPCVGGALF
jgi:hypothetical protein